MTTFAGQHGFRTAYRLVRRHHPMGTVEEDLRAAHRPGSEAFHSIDLQHPRLLPDGEVPGAEPGERRRSEGSLPRGPFHPQHPGSPRKADGSVYKGRDGVSGYAGFERVPHYEGNPGSRCTRAVKGY